MIRVRLLLAWAAGVLLITSIGFAQDTGSTDAPPAAENANDAPPTETSDTTESVPEEVSVNEVVLDEDIADRLERILKATGWFENPQARVDQGVVFLTGRADEAEHSQWAAKLARNTEDVVAVVNRMSVVEPPLWNITPAINVLGQLTRDLIQALPLAAIALVILLLSFLANSLAVRIADATVLKRIDNKLLREVARKALAISIILLGVYLMLTVSGLSRLAVTVIGGTGLFGLVLGVAFRDIMENFLASILISIQNPFKYGDLVEVDGHKGYVQRVNMRGTLLMTLEGNHIQIPNSTVYKNTIQNFTSNPNVRFDFVIGVGYDASITHAQELAIEVLQNHPAVLDDPEPIVLVEELGPSTVNLRAYFWVNARQHSGGKVKSSAIRQVMRKLETAGISLPDDAREVIFPSGVPVQMLPDNHETPAHVPRDNQARPTDSADEVVSNSGEGDFASEADDINEQAKRSRDPEDDQSDLLEGDKTTAEIAPKEQLVASPQ